MYICVLKNVIFTINTCTGVISFAMVDTDLLKSNLGVMISSLILLCVCERIVTILYYLFTVLKYENISLKCMYTIRFLYCLMSVCVVFLINKTIDQDNCNDSSKLSKTVLCFYTLLVCISCIIIFNVFCSIMFVKLVRILLIRSTVVISPNQTIVIQPNITQPPDTSQPCIVQPGTICSVCLLEDNASWVVTRCNHQFHRICMNNIRSHGHNICPLCRNSLV